MSSPEYAQLQRWLLQTTAVLGGIVFALCWGVYGLDTGLSYLLGTVVGLMYLRLLARSVATLGLTSTRFSPLPAARLLLVVALFILVVRRPHLHLLPAILGFLTYKLAILLYTMQVVLTGSQDQVRPTAAERPLPQPPSQEPLPHPSRHVLGELARLRAEQQAGDQG
ncbi:MAG: ATP synthase subunit I [Gloeomargarita sp. GMQP_bins_120]